MRGIVLPSVHSLNGVIPEGRDREKDVWGAPEEARGLAHCQIRSESRLTVLCVPLRSLLVPLRDAVSRYGESLFLQPQFPINLFRCLWPVQHNCNGPTLGDEITRFEFPEATLLLLQAAL
jgi:hypothetical protein